ncbi:hypothetical protein AS850_00515 [Frondihabitans sp. 762G35]|uniref:DUF4232 domain-containing protein n=1 Tax=Frondihabitans sp. 762G35 TaxID=1446794 RepID=UPI000D203549|nr:DUF4232 domain-containing protein [Frondihabitans sp. 762G35]ARC55558.1 hypothetical protein AS850_00515 [Frondihabitans sp. 762G35]
MSTRTRFAVVALVSLAGLGLAGCSGTSTAPAETPVTASAPASTAPSTPATDGTSPMPTTSTGTGTGTGTSGSTAACTTTNLRATAGPNDGAAGSVYVKIVLTNAGSASCTLQGWPGVSFVGNGNGSQIGKAAAFDRTSAHPTVTLAPGKTASAQLRIVQAGVYDATECKPTTADGFRVYPPGQTASLFVKDAGVAACASSSVSLLTVGALQ